jgi:hypothetical protein
MKTRIKLAVAILMVAILVFAVSYGPYVWVSVYSALFGQRDIVSTAKEIASNETDPVVALNQIANWLNSHITYDPRGFYFFPMPPFLLSRRVPAQATWTMTVRRGACEEEAVLCTEMARSVGIQARTVYNSAEDHTWCEILINGSWTQFDPGLSEDKRFNNPGFYERPEPNGWGKQLSYVYFIGPDGKKNDISKTYTGTGGLTVQVEKDGQPVENARVVIESRFLMENYPSSYSQPQFCLENHTDSRGLCAFDLGGNNYTVIAELGTILGYRNETIISLKENSETSVTLALANLSLLVSIEDVLAAFVWAIVTALLAAVAVLLYGKYRKFKKEAPTEVSDAGSKLDCVAHAKTGNISETGMWVFGYGSLIWDRSDIKPVEERIGELLGWHRDWTWISSKRCGAPTCSLQMAGKVKGVFLRLDPKTQQSDLEILRKRELRQSEEFVENMSGINGKICFWTMGNNLDTYEDTRGLNGIELYRALAKRAKRITSLGRDGKTAEEYAFAVHEFDPGDELTKMYVTEIRRLSEARFSSSEF